MQNGANNKKTCFIVRIKENERIPSQWEACFWGGCEGGFQRTSREEQMNRKVHLMAATVCLHDVSCLENGLHFTSPLNSGMSTLIGGT